MTPNLNHWSFNPSPYVSTYKLHVICKKGRKTEKLWQVVTATSWGDAIEKAIHNAKYTYDREVIPFTAEEINGYMDLVEKENKERRKMEQDDGEKSPESPA